MKEKHFHISGWILFTICSILYMYDSFMASNIVAFIGGLFFFFGCVAFIIPLVK
ncbi:hypothetical protein [Clostridium sp. DL1XJH146]